MVQIQPLHPISALPTARKGFFVNVHQVYLISNAEGQSYARLSEDIALRLSQHNAGLSLMPAKTDDGHSSGPASPVRSTPA